MATLYFKVSSDYQEVIRLRQECEKLEAQLKKMDVTKSPAAARALETQLAATRQQMVGLVTEAANAGAVMEHNLKNKLNAASKASDELTEEIIKQKKIIRDTQEDVRRLSEEYSKMSKYSPNSKAKLTELNTAKAALNEQRYSLGELQDQQARNRLEVRKLTREYKEFTNGTTNADAVVKSLTDSLKRTAAEIGGLVAIKKFGSDVIDATGKMQQLQVALSTILQSKSKADQLIGEIIQFAAKTPFNLDDVATGAKQLLAYGSSADKVVSELSMLGDVASGLQIPIGQLIYLYGTLRTQGRAMTVDIRQFAGRGIPIYEELAKVLGVSKDQVGELVKEGKVGFKEVEQAFKNMTSEGGKFANLMENSAGTWPQRLSNIQDTLFQKMNDFGNKYKEVFEFGIGTAEDLAESLDDVLSVIGGLIAAYGTYKAALITAAVAQKAVGFLESIRLIAMYRKELGLATAAQQAFNVAAKSNVYVTLLSVLVGVGTAVYMFTKRTNEATAAQEALNSVNKKSDEEFSKQAATIDRLTGVLKSETSSLDQKKKALSDLQSIVPSYNASLDEEGKLINNNTEAIKSYLTQLEKQIRMKAAQEELEELYRKKRAQEKQQKEATANYNEAKSLYSSSLTMTNSSLQNRGINTSVAVFSQNSAVNNQLKDSVNKAKNELDSVNKELGETLSSINTIEKEIEQSSLSDKKNVSQSTISKEVQDTTNRIKTLKKEIADLRSGNTQAEVGKTVESVIKAKEKELKAANETLEILTGNKPQTTKQENSTSQQQASILELERRQAQERIRQQIDLENQTEQARINAMRDGAERVKAQRELDNKEELEAIEKQKQDYIQKTIQAQKEIFDAEEKLKASKDKNYRVRTFDSFSVNVDTSIFDSISSDTKEKQIMEGLKLERDALNSYLQEYGTFQQRKYAIAQEYADKIAKAQTNTEKMMLGKERDSKLSGIESDALKANIDWATVFGEFGGMFYDMIKPALEDAKKYMQTDGFKNSDASSQQSIVEAVNQMEKSLGGTGGLDFKKLGEDVQAYQNSVVSLNLAKEQEADALESLAKAQEDYENALKNGTDEQKNATQKALENAQSNADLASANVQMQSENVKNAQKGMSETATALKANMDNVVNGLQQIASGGLTNIYNGLIQAGKGVGGAAGKLADSLESVPVVGWILSIIDIFKDGISVVISGLLDSVFSAVSGIIEDVLSGDLFVSIGESLMKGIGSIFDAISFGGFSKLTSIGSNAKEVQEAIDRLTDRNEALQGSIDALNDTIKAGRGAISVDAARKAVKYQEEQNANYLKIAQEQARYSGNHHSWNYYWGGFTQSQINDFSNQIGRSWNGSIWNLSPEEMKLLKGNVDMWTQIQNTGKGGYGGRLTEKLDDYIEQAGKIEELETQLNESLTGMTFDSMYDSFIDTLMDMDASAEDFADNMSEYFMRAMLSNKIGELYYDRLNEWYEEFATRMKDGTLDDNELEYLQGKWNGIVSDAIKERDDIASAIGYDNKKAQEQQSASSRGFGTEMTHEDAGELSGRFTAMHESNLRIETAEQQQTVAITELRGSISALTAQASGLYNIADETRTILANSYLELQQIRENTGEIVKPIKQIQTDIAEVKQNTSRL